MKDKKYIVFTCPHCGGHELKRLDTIVYEMDAIVGQDAGNIYGGGNMRETGETQTSYKCASCGKEMSKKEVYANIARTEIPQNVPRIVIDYKLYTDGDYGLDNPKKWGAVSVEEGGVDYIGHVEFTGSGYLMRNLAANFLWEMVGGNEGLRFGAGHHWLLREFYDMFERLEDGILQLNKDNTEISDGLTGNQAGTEFVVRLEGDLSQLEE